MRENRPDVGIGNRTSLVAGEATTLYNTNTVNQYTGVTAPTSPPDGGYSYDLRGNLLDDGTRRFTWDLQNNLRKVNIRRSPNKVSYDYDGGSRRIAGIENGAATLYISDRWNVLAEFNLTNDQATLSKRHVWGTDLSEPPKEQVESAA